MLGQLDEQLVPTGLKACRSLVLARHQPADRVVGVDKFAVDPEFDTVVAADLQPNGLFYRRKNVGPCIKHAMVARTQVGEIQMPGLVRSHCRDRPPSHMRCRWVFRREHLVEQVWTLPTCDSVRAGHLPAGVEPLQKIAGLGLDGGLGGTRGQLFELRLSGCPRVGQSRSDANEGQFGFEPCFGIDLSDLFHPGQCFGMWVSGEH